MTRRALDLATAVVVLAGVATVAEIATVLLLEHRWLPMIAGSE